MAASPDPLFDLFRREGQALLAAMQARLQEFVAGEAQRAAAKRLQQHAHTLGGLGAALGREDIRTAARQVERAVDMLDEEKNPSEPVLLAYHALRKLVLATLEEGEPQEQGALGHSEEKSAEKNPPTVLVVDDSRTILHFLALTLGRAGFRVLTAATENAAAEVLAREKVGLVLLDVSVVWARSPESLLAGLGVHRETLPPVLLLSNRPEDELRALAASAGAAGALPKTHDGTRIVATVAAALEKGRTA